MPATTVRLAHSYPMIRASALTAASDPFADSFLLGLRPARVSFRVSHKDFMYTFLHHSLLLATPYPSQSYPASTAHSQAWPYASFLSFLFSSGPQMPWLLLSERLWHLPLVATMHSGTHYPVAGNSLSVSPSCSSPDRPPRAPST